jgi:outer membrane immunogenic protein
MRHALATVVITAGLMLGGAALAAPKPHHPPADPPPPPAPVWTWTGFYVGGNAGYSWGNSNSTVSFSDPTGLLFSSQSNFGVNGAVGGGQIGYDWQTANWVFGVVTDFQGSGQNGSGIFVCPVSACSNGPFTESLSQRLRWFGTVRGNIGITTNMSEYLWYVTGGLAYGNIRTVETITGPGAVASLTFNDTNTGFAIGTGVRGHIVGNWSWMIEYLYMDLGTINTTGATGIVTSGLGFCDTHVCLLAPGSSSKFTDNILRFGINLKWP